MILSDLNIELYAAQNYLNNNYADAEEFYEDYNRFKYLKRLCKKFATRRELNDRLILNHLVVLYNVFENECCTRLLFYHCEQYLDILKPYLIFIQRLPKYVLDKDERQIVTSTIPMNQIIVKSIRNNHNVS